MVVEAKYSSRDVYDGLTELLPTVIGDLHCLPE